MVVVMLILRCGAAPDTARYVLLIGKQSCGSGGIFNHALLWRQYRHAALLQDQGDRKQAQTHVNIAGRHAMSATAVCDLHP